MPISMINSSLLQNQAVELLQSFQANQPSSSSPDEEENKTATEKIHDIISGQTDKTVAAAKARIAEAQLKAATVEVRNDEDVDFGFTVEGTHYVKVSDMSEEVRINVYIAAKEIEHYIRDIIIDSGVLDNTRWLDLETDRYKDAKNWKAGGEVYSDADFSSRVSAAYLDYYWQEFVDLDTPGKWANFWPSWEYMGFDPVFQEFHRMTEITQSIQYYYAETYGRNSLEYLTLAEDLVEDRAESLAERDAIVSEFGEVSAEHVAYMTNFYYENTKLDYAQMETSGGLGIHFYRTSTGYGTVLRQKLEADVNYITFDSETGQINSFESGTVESTVLGNFRWYDPSDTERRFNHGDLEGFRGYLEELEANGQAIITAVSLDEA
ncbi:hypothetical protein [Flexibacterium corallicola]|uniref:hypothetical protein n=1 Tax=Flexibacterium corallicola TaxID=3037259 RepID=UPI00286EC402|nr:hypothetical protein [Pseudovibrio sp. M1P-2-3]